MPCAKKLGVIFQDFARYQLKVGENIGVGDKDFMAESGLVTVASEKRFGRRLHPSDARAV